MNDWLAFTCLSGSFPSCSYVAKVSDWDSVSAYAQNIMTWRGKKSISYQNSSWIETSFSHSGFRASPSHSTFLVSSYLLLLLHLLSLCNRSSPSSFTAQCGCELLSLFQDDKQSLREGGWGHLCLSITITFLHTTHQGARSVATAGLWHRLHPDAPPQW